MMERLQRVTDLSNPTIEVVYQPGNGTSYKLYFARLQSMEWLLAWVNGGRVGHACTVLAPADEFLHWMYFQEKSGLKGE